MMMKNKIKVSIRANLGGLSKEEKWSLRELQKTAGIIDSLYLKQSPKPEKIDFYPKGLTKEKFEKYLKSHPRERKELESHFTVVRGDLKNLKAIPYSEFYKTDLDKLVGIIINVAKKTKDIKFKRYLLTKADGFRTNDFSKSDLQWINLKSPIELTIGPYEEYDDFVWGTKRSFELVLSVAIKREKKKVVKFQKWAGDFDKVWAKKYKYKVNGSARTMLIVDEVMAGGHSRIGFIPMAYNLPNDTWIRQKYGSKQVFMRNVMHAKFNNITRKVADIVVDKKIANSFNADDYILSIIRHELAHGFGVYCKNGLRELGHGLEEAKADVYGIVFLYWLADKGYISQKTTFAAAVSKTIDGLRQIRFGQKEAHAIGAVIQYRWLMNCGALKIMSGKFVIDQDKLRMGQESLSEVFADLAFSEDYQKAKKFIAKWGTEIPEFKPIIKKMSKLSIDIIPVFG